VYLNYVSILYGYMFKAVDLTAFTVNMYSSKYNYFLACCSNVNLRKYHSAYVNLFIDEDKPLICACFLLITSVEYEVSCLNE